MSRGVHIAVSQLPSLLLFLVRMSDCPSRNRHHPSAAFCSYPRSKRTSSRHLHRLRLADLGQRYHPFYGTTARPLPPRHLSEISVKRPLQTVRYDVEEGTNGACRFVKEHGGWPRCQKHTQPHPPTLSPSCPCPPIPYGEAAPPTGVCRLE